MSIDAAPPEPPVGLRRWTRFSIRSLLLAVVAVSIGLALWLKYLEPYRRQARAISVLRQLKPLKSDDPRVASFAQFFDSKGVIRFSSEPAGPAWARAWFGDEGLMRVTKLDATICSLDNASAAQVGQLNDLEELSCTYTLIGDDGVRHFSRLHELRALDLSRTKITDDALRHLAELHKLEHLRLSETQITDAGLEHLRALTRLHTLILMDCKVAGPGIAWLQDLPELEYLNLQNTHITDDELRHVGKLKRLKHLCLGYLPLTDQGLKHLAGLNELQWIQVHRTKITNEALKTLRALPALEFVFVDDTEVTNRAIAAELPELFPRRIRRVLAEPMKSVAPVEWSTLGDVLDDISSITSVTIQMDERAVRGSGVDLEETFKVPLNGRVMEEVLDELLKVRGLTWVLRHEMLVVTTPEGKLRPPPKLLQEADTPPSEQLLEALATGSWLDFHDTPLPEVVALLRQACKCDIRVDESAMQDRPVPNITSSRFRHPKLRHWLEFVLDQHGLVGVIQGDILWIRPAVDRN